MADQTTCVSPNPNHPQYVAGWDAAIAWKNKHGKKWDLILVAAFLGGVVGFWIAAVLA